MGDILEKKLKEFLPYIIIIGAVFLLLPLILIMLGNDVMYNYIVLMGIFPLVTLCCGFYYANKKKFDMSFSFVAPVIFIFTMFLYGIFKANPLNSLIFLVAYFICGYIGLTVGDMLKKKENKQSSEDTGYVRHRKKNVPKRVATTTHVQHVEETVDDIEMPQSFDEHPHEVEEVSSYDDEYDIDAILAEIHNRRQD